MTAAETAVLIEEHMRTVWPDAKVERGEGEASVWVYLPGGPQFQIEVTKWMRGSEDEGPLRASDLLGIPVRDAG